MDEQLKNCPFCGGEANLSEQQGENLWDHNIVTWQSVTCGNIGCENQGFSWPEGAEPNAIEQWNARVPDVDKTVHIPTSREQAELMMSVAGSYLQ